MASARRYFSFKSRGKDINTRRLEVNAFFFLPSFLKLTKPNTYVVYLSLILKGLGVVLTGKITNKSTSF